MAANSRPGYGRCSVSNFLTSSVRPVGVRPICERFLRDAWRLARPYWYSEERWPARLQLILIVGLTLGLVAILVLLNDWNRQFYEALQNYDFAAF
jgi:ABC-type uncharacterized transport system fused permease/ATPase subunit